MAGQNDRQLFLRSQSRCRITSRLHSYEGFFYLPVMVENDRKPIAISRSRLCLCPGAAARLFALSLQTRGEHY